MTQPNATTDAERGELHTQLFANIVMQQAGMAMIFLGVTPHPETGQMMFDLEGAQHFISQLEMIEAKTKGNLVPEETAMLKQGLTAVRMAFVQSVERGAPTGIPTEPAAAMESSPTPAVEAGGANPEPPAATDEGAKKFVKKY